MSKKRQIKPRDREPYDLGICHASQSDAWFYTNKSSIELVVQNMKGTPITVHYRLKLSDLRRIVEGLSK